VTEDRHPEIAARLREEGMRRAPEGLRADVMQHVRAEPRRRPVRWLRPRSYARPLAALAAAACIVAASVVGASHLSGAGSNAVVAGGGGASAGASRAPSLETAGPKLAKPLTTPAPTRVNAPHEQAIYGAVAGKWLARTPLPLRRAYAGRAALASPLPKALEPYGPMGRGTHSR
jgi:hypothetical protein